MKTIIRLAFTGLILSALPVAALAADGDSIWTGIDRTAPHRPIIVTDDTRAPRALLTENVFTDLSLTAPLRKDVADGSDGTLAGE